MDCRIDASTDNLCCPLKFMEMSYHPADAATRLIMEYMKMLPVGKLVRIPNSDKFMDSAGIVHPTAYTAHELVEIMANYAIIEKKAAGILMDYIMLRNLFPTTLDLCNALIMAHGCPRHLIFLHKNQKHLFSAEYKDKIINDLFLNGNTYIPMLSFRLSPTERMYLEKWNFKIRDRKLIPCVIDYNYPRIKDAITANMGWNRQPFTLNDGSMQWAPDDPIQQEAFKMMITRQISVMTGSAGTGKTTTIVQYLYYLKALFIRLHRDFMLRNPTKTWVPPPVALVAFTGKAVSNLREKAIQVDPDDFMKLKYFTIHSLVLSTKGNKYHHIICDEASMLDEFMMCTFLNLSKKITLVGDPNQLQALGCGDVFNLFINAVPTVKLLNNYRCDSFLRDNMTAIYNREYHKLAFQDYDSCEEGLFYLEGDLDLCVKLYEEWGGIIICGTNAEVNYVNDVMYEKWGIYPGTPIMTTTNTEEYMNGEIFEFVSLNGSNLVLTDSTEREIIANSAHCVLAYGITVDKSQGSQFSTVIYHYVSSPFSHRNRIYTALSRSQERAIIVTKHNYSVFLDGLNTEPPARNHLYGPIQKTSNHILGTNHFQDIPQKRTFLSANKVFQSGPIHRN